MTGLLAILTGVSENTFYCLQGHSLTQFSMHPERGSARMTKRGHKGRFQAPPNGPPKRPTSTTTFWAIFVFSPLVCIQAKHKQCPSPFEPNLPSNSPRSKMASFADVISCLEHRALSLKCTTQPEHSLIRRDSSSQNLYELIHASSSAAIHLCIFVSCGTRPSPVHHINAPTNHCSSPSRYTLVPLCSCTSMIHPIG